MIPWLSLSVITGMLCGAIELWSRYSHAPKRIMVCWASLLFIMANGAASGLAMELIFQLRRQWISELPLITAILAGTGGVALLRSSLVRVPMMRQEVRIAPFLELLLQTTDKEVENIRLTILIPQLRDAMIGVDYAKAAEYLPQTCLGRRRQLGRKELNRISLEIKTISAAVSEDHAKCVRLGLLIAEFSSLRVLQCALRSTDLLKRHVDVGGQRVIVSLDELISFYADPTNDHEKRS
jgi:hypothetical protein